MDRPLADRLLWHVVGFVFPQEKILRSAVYKILKLAGTNKRILVKVTEVTFFEQVYRCS